MFDNVMSFSLSRFRWWLQACSDRIDIERTIEDNKINEARVSKKSAATDTVQIIVAAINQASIRS